jgi:uncharacterized OsmC-like protein/fermentation-respiration switch protein FrsA (DUF1100 family)
MSAQVFDFIGAEGQTLSGRLDLPDHRPQTFALLAHCFTCTKNSIAAVRIARALSLAGIGVLRFDFTGLGQSEGDFADTTFSANVQDLIMAARAMAAQGYAPSLLIGHSLGGAAVLAAASQLPLVRAVATIAAPFDVAHVEKLLGDGLQALRAHGEAEVQLGGRPFKLRRSFIDDLQTHDQKQRIAQLRRALLVMHAPGDATVDIDNATSIFQAARHPKSFVSLDDADHLLTRAADAEYAAQVIAAWAARYVGSSRPTRAGSDKGQVTVEETGAGGLQVEVQAGGVRFIADEPVEVGGLGSGPTPYDLLCAALGACTVMTLRLYGRRKGWPLAKVRVGVGHVRATTVSTDRFVREIELVGDLTAEQRARLIEMAGRCPVHLTLERGSKVETIEVSALQPMPDVETADQHVRDIESETSDSPS